MTRLEEAVWAAAYVSTMEMVSRHQPMTRGDLHTIAVREADCIIMAMRRTVDNCRGRLHDEDQLEREREESA